MRDRKICQNVSDAAYGAAMAEAERRNTSTSAILDECLGYAAMAPAATDRLRAVALALNVPQHVVVEAMLLDEVARERAELAEHGRIAPRDLPLRFDEGGPVTGDALLALLTEDHRTRLRQQRNRRHPQPMPPDSAFETAQRVLDGEEQR